MPLDKIERLNISHIGISGLDISTASVYSCSPHMHAYYEMLFYQPFDGYVMVNGIEIKVDSATILFMTPSDLHKTHCNTPSNSKYIKVAFNQKLLGINYNLLPKSAIVLTNIQSNDIMEILFNQLEVNSDNIYDALIINAIVYQLSKRGKIISLANNRSNTNLVSKTLSIINEHFCEEITLSQIANSLSISSQHLSQVFSKEVGMGFSNYICELRLSYASELLQHTEKSVTEICFLCGYRNLSHFQHSFKSRFGVSPKKFSDLYKVYKSQ